MDEQFTASVRTIMQLANQEAQRFGHERIDSVHILLGLLREGTGVAAYVLRNLRVDLSQVRMEVENLVIARPADTEGNLPLTPQAKNVIEYAMEAARELHHNYVGSEHLLLGLLGDQDGVVSRVLANFGVTSDKATSEILKLLDPMRTPFSQETNFQVSLVHRFPQRLVTAVVACCVIVIFFVLREWWIRSQDQGKTWLVPIILASIVCVVSAISGMRTISTASITALTAFVSTSAISIETICLSKPAAFMHADDFYDQYNTDVRLHILAIGVVTGISFVVGGILSLPFEAVHNLFSHRSVVKSPWRPWLMPTERKAVTLGLVSVSLLFGGYAAFNWLSWLKNSAFADLWSAWCIGSWLAGGPIAGVLD